MAEFFNSTVSEIVRYLKRKNEDDLSLSRVSLEGELSNVKVYPSGHMYFDLKDDKAKISGIMFASNLKKMMFKPVAGDKVLVSGSIKVYENNAIFQIVATNIDKDGIGALFVEFEKNKKMLEAQGYFDQKYKKAIPTTPNMIAVIAGHNSAALKDVLTTLNKRFKLSKVVAFPTLVQGLNAPAQLIEMINLVNKYPFDVIILARGGGSFEDINAFNDVNLAKTIFNSRIPIVTGVGHEVDFTIADFVSDYRAATPTAAAVKVSLSKDDVNKILLKDYTALNKAFNNKLNSYQQQLNNYINNRVLSRPQELYLNKAQRLDNYYALLVQSMSQKIQNERIRLQKLEYNIEKNNIKFKLQDYKNTLLKNQEQLKLLYQNKIQDSYQQNHDLMTNLNKSYELYLSKKQEELTTNADTLRFMLVKYNHDLNQQKNNLLNKFQQLETTNKNHLKSIKQKLNEKVITLNLLDPEIILDKGFNIVYKDDVLIKDYSTLKTNDQILIKNKNQKLLATVNEVNINGRK